MCGGYYTLLLSTILDIDKTTNLPRETDTCDRMPTSATSLTAASKTSVVAVKVKQSACVTTINS